MKISDDRVCCKRLVPVSIIQLTILVALCYVYVVYHFVWSIPCDTRLPSPPTRRHAPDNPKYCSPISFSLHSCCSPSYVLSTCRCYSCHISHILCRIWSSRQLEFNFTILHPTNLTHSPTVIPHFVDLVTFVIIIHVDNVHILCMHHFVCRFDWSTGTGMSTMEGRKMCSDLLFRIP